MKRHIQFPSIFPELHADQIMLTQFSKADANCLYEIRKKKDFVKYLAVDPMKSVEEAEKMIEGINQSYQNRKGISWKICQKESEKLIGYIGFWRIIPEHFRAEIGFGIHPKYQNQGLMKKACSLVLAYGFEQLKIHSILADVDPLNLPSIKLLESQGFRKEGFLRESFYLKGKFTDSAYYGLLESDFR